MKRVKTNGRILDNLSQPALHQHTRQIQEYDTVINDVPLGLSVGVRQEVVDNLNIILAETMTLRDLYKKSHWQVSGATFYQLHLLFDKHYMELNDIVDILAERIQLLGGISIAMAADVAETTTIERAPRGREEVPAQLSRLLEAHEIVIKKSRSMAKRSDELGDDATNDVLISNVLRTNELQAWFLYEHLVNLPLVIVNKK